MLPTFNVPPVGPRQGKVWGSTQLVFAHNSTESHLIRVKAGGYCSRHVHQYKWNRFVVISGKLEVRLFQEHGTVDATMLTDGQITDVPPGIAHLFLAHEDTVAIEIYWVSIDPHDIDRGGTCGGVAEQADNRFMLPLPNGQERPDDLCQCQPHWEAVPAEEHGEVIGYQVRWSEPDEEGKYLWIGHYMKGENSLGWCERAATNDAERKNMEKKLPTEYPSVRG